MAIQYSKVVCSILLSLLAVILFLRNRREERKLCMVAMILSGIGDIFMTDVLKLGSAGSTVSLCRHECRLDKREPAGTPARALSCTACALAGLHRQR